LRISNPNANAPRTISVRRAFFALTQVAIKLKQLMTMPMDVLIKKHASTVA